MRLPEEIVKSVVFLGLPGQGSEDAPPLLRGTAFLVGVPTKSGENHVFYLVTTRHNAEQLEGRRFVVRFNLKNGGVACALGKEETRWWRHPTEPDSVDVAVLPWTLPAKADLKVLTLEWFLTKAVADDRVGPGDPVYFPSLFTLMAGQQKNIPIVRTGNIAMMPSESVPGITGCGDADVFLIEARSIGGISGAPVFARQTLNVDVFDKKTNEKHLLHGSGFLHLLGLMHGHWSILPQDKNRARIQPVKVKSEPDGVNLGIAIVVPAEKILETLHHPELVAMREDLENKAKKDTTEQDFATAEEDQKDQKRTFTKSDFESALKKASRKRNADHQKRKSPGQ